MLMNAGFSEVRLRDKYDCFIFHDVDMIPLDDRNFFTCSLTPRHVAAYVDKWHFRRVDNISVDVLISIWFRVWSTVHNLIIIPGRSRVRPISPLPKCCKKRRIAKAIYCLIGARDSINYEYEYRVDHPVVRRLYHQIKLCYASLRYNTPPPQSFIAIQVLKNQLFKYNCRSWSYIILLASRVALSTLNVTKTVHVAVLRRSL